MKTQSVPEIRQEIKNAGFDEVETYAGWVPVKEWKPYGQSETLKSIAMDVDENNHRVMEYNVSPEYPSSNCFVIGCWPLR
jgi:hypothetical protein